MDSAAIESINAFPRFMCDGHFRMNRQFDPIEMKRHSTIDPPLAGKSTGEIALRGLRMAREKVLLRVCSVFRIVGIELGKIYRTQNHTKLARETFISNGVGLLMGMLSAQFVSQFFDVKGFHNLWGMMSNQTIVSRDTYQVLCFGAKFFVALLVFTLTDHFINEYRSRRENRAQAKTEPDRITRD